jgi:hypothetical protein
MEPLPPLRDIARPFEAPKLPAGRPEADYVDAFLSVFGAARGKPVIYRDASGHVIPIGEELFQRPDGSSKLAKHGRERGPDLARMAEAIADPDEIWIDWGIGPDGKYRLVRRYLRTSPDSPEFASFGWTANGWEGATAFPPTKGAAGKPNPSYLERQRTGALIYRRPKK